MEIKNLDHLGLVSITHGYSRDVDGVETFVADCALCSEDNVSYTNSNGIRFVTETPGP